MKQSRVERVLAALFVAVLLPTSFAQTNSIGIVAPILSKQTSPSAHGPHLEGKEVTLPLVLIRGFPFIDGAINGKVGTLLFDVGAASSLTVNTHSVTVPGGIRTGNGFFGSGQTYETFSLPLVDKLELPNGLKFTGLTNLSGHSGVVLEQDIAADFIGWLGIGFFDGYVLKLDYGKPAVTFYRDDASGAGERAALTGEQVLQTIKVDNKGHRNLLNFYAKVKGVECQVILDTGSHTAAWMTDQQIITMKQNGALSESIDGSTILSGLEIDGHTIKPMPVDVTPGKPPMAKFLPTTQDPVIALGYEFLSRYRTVWNYDAGTLTLLAQ